LGDSWESEHGREAKVEADAALALDAADAAVAAAVDVAVGQDADAGEPPSQLSDTDSLPNHDIF
jgi:hypothetical protein